MRKIGPYYLNFYLLGVLAAGFLGWVFMVSLLMFVFG